MGAAQAMSLATRDRDSSLSGGKTTKAWCLVPKNGLFLGDGKQKKHTKLCVSQKQHVLFGASGMNTIQCFQTRLHFFHCVVCCHWQPHAFDRSMCLAIIKMPESLLDQTSKILLTCFCSKPA